MKSINIKDRNFLIKVNNNEEYENVLERIKELGDLPRMEDLYLPKIGVI